MGDEVCDFSAVKVFSDCPAHVMDQIDEVNLRKHAFNESKSSDFEISTHPTPDMSWKFQTHHFIFFTETSEAQR